jgi:prepilin-type N-terminal cleavage/methylation domain-containing protein
MRSYARARSGFSLVEIITALVILAVIGVALTKMVVGQARSFQIDNGNRRARTASRNAMNILTTDLRMAQDFDAIDSIDTANNRWIDLKVPIAFGVVCEVNAGNAVLSVAAVDSFQTATSKYGGYAVRSTTTGLYGYSKATSSDTVQATDVSRCQGGPKIGLDSFKVANRRGAVVLVSPGPPAGTVAGEPAFIFQHVRYQFDTSGIYRNRYGLYRTIRGRGNTDKLTEELIAPFDAAARFYYYTNPWTYRDTVTKTAPTNLNTIRGFQIYLPAQSSDTVPGAKSPRKSTTRMAVFFKNTRVQ